MKKLVVVGSINLDLVASAHRIPLAGETISGTAFHTFPGGKGANQAFAAARLGAPVSMIGMLGSDAFGAQLRASLEQAGVDTRTVDVAPGSSGIALITAADNGENAIVVVGGANAQLLPRDLDRHLEVIRAAGMLLTQLEIPMETVEHLAGIARRENIRLMLDPAPARPLPAAVLASVEWLTPNETETCTLLGSSAHDLPPQDLQAAALELMRQGSRNVLLKLGSRGCYLALANGQRTLLSAYAVRAVDTTAAGDALNAAFALALLQGKDPVAAARWSSAVAAISVTRHGAQPSMPTAVEVEAFLEGQPPLQQG
jgi:ribokinase